MTTAIRTGAILLKRTVVPDIPPEAIRDCAGHAYVLSVPAAAGAAALTYDGRKIFDAEIRPGMMRALSPGQEVSVALRTPMNVARLHVPSSLFHQIATEYGHAVGDHAPDMPWLVERPSPLIQRLTSSLLAVDDVDPSQRQLFLQGLTLALLAAAFDAALSRGKAVERGTRGLSDRQWAACIDFVDSRLDQRVDIATWAAVLGLTPRAFTRRFHQTARTAPYAWLLNWRIDRAKGLLATTENDLAQIALQVGFSTQSHFADAFRRRTGESPGRWRRKLG